MGAADAASIATDAITAGTALAGLLLVFLGNAVSEYGSFDSETSPLVKTRYQRQATAAFIGFCCALLSAAFAFAGKVWCATFVAVALLLLLAAFISTAISGFILMREIS